MRAFLNDSRIKYIKKENTGAAHTRNVGVEGASNEWITFLDSDDEATPDWLAKFAEKLLAGAEIVTCGLQKYDEKGVLTSTTIPKQNKRNIGGQFTNGGVYLLRKSVFNQEVCIGIWHQNIDHTGTSDQGTHTLGLPDPVRSQRQV
jgi:glycosyltransferase involved in cell wall biosynthesis